MILKVPLTGNGKDATPYRTSFPTATVLEVDYAAGTCIIEVPDDLLPPELQLIRPTETVPTVVGDVVVGLDQEQQDAIGRFFAEMYPANVAKLSPEVLPGG